VVLERGHEDHRDERRGRVRLQPLADLEAALAGKLDIEQHHVGRRDLDAAHGALAVGHAFHRHAGEQAGEESRHVRIVLHHQNPEQISGGVHS
jgi:hypothetical protein